MRRILAIGGGGFQTEDGPSPIDHALLQLTGKTQPRICLLSTASGDLPEYIERFHAAFAEPSCVASHLAFYARDSRPGAVNLTNLREALHDQDAVFVSGGNMRAALAVWREYGLDRLLAEVLETVSNRQPERLRQNLQRHVSVELGICGSIHLPHTTFADLDGDGVRAEGGACLEWHRSVHRDTLSGQSDVFREQPLHLHCASAVIPVRQLGLMAQGLPRPLHEMEEEPNETTKDPARDTQQRDDHPARALYDSRVRIAKAAGRTRQRFTWRQDQHSRHARHEREISGHRSMPSDSDCATSFLLHARPCASPWNLASRSGSLAKASGRIFNATCRFSLVSVARFGVPAPRLAALSGSGSAVVRRGDRSLRPQLDLELWDGSAVWPLPQPLVRVRHGA